MGHCLLTRWGIIFCGRLPFLISHRCHGAINMNLNLLAADSEDRQALDESEISRLNLSTVSKGLVPWIVCRCASNSQILVKRDL